MYSYTLSLSASTMPLEPSPIGIQSSALNAAHDAAVEDHKLFVREQVAAGLTEKGGEGTLERLSGTRAGRGGRKQRRDVQG